MNRKFEKELEMSCGMCWRFEETCYSTIFIYNQQTYNNITYLEEEKEAEKTELLIRLPCSHTSPIF